MLPASTDCDPKGKRHRRSACCRMMLCTMLPISGCAAIPTDERDLLARPPDCSQAESQIAELEKIKPSGLEQVTATAGLVSPAGLAGMAVHGDYQDRRRIIDGSYGAEIDAKIAEIRQACAP
jgi:hypothetical protein